MSNTTEKKCFNFLNIHYIQIFKDQNRFMHLNLAPNVPKLYLCSAPHRWHRMMMEEGSCQGHPASAPWQEHWMNALPETRLWAGPQTALARLHPHCDRNTNRHIHKFWLIAKTQCFTNMLVGGKGSATMGVEWEVKKLIIHGWHTVTLMLDQHFYNIMQSITITMQ